VYASALVFSPSRSITRNHFENEEPKWIIRKPAMADNWSACLQTLEGHRDWVSSVAWSHDATRLASASSDNTVKIWDPATGQCVSTLEGHSGWVSLVAWSHDATRLASASDDETVKIWDPATGQCVSTLEGHSGSVSSVAWSHDATRLASASDDNTVKIWDPATGQCVSTLEGHSGWVSSVAWSHDATRLASASDDNKVKIWDPATGQCVSTLEGHSRSVSSVAWSHDATRLASASSDETVKIWDPATGQCVSTLRGYSDLRNLQFHQSNSDLLHTELGTFDLRTVAISTVLGPASADHLLPIAVEYGLSSNRTWITYQGENLLWLPAEYRPSSSAISGTAVSIGCFSGRILIFTFSDADLIR
jgi:WD40 repeat protein